MSAAATTAAIVLAAGGSTRLGRPKQQIRFGGRTLARRAVDAAMQAGCDPVLVVLGACATSVQHELADSGARLALNSDWAEGISSSIRRGLEALESEAFETLLLLTCDQPLIDAVVIRRIREAYNGRAGCMVASAYAGTIGVPALFERSCIDRLRCLTGDRGAKQLLLDSPDTLQVDWPQGAIDIDRPEDMIPGAH
jgi:molybdenum cofactor cytidylyltransferase